MGNFSLTTTSLLVFIVTAVFKQADIDISSHEIEEGVAFLVQIAALIGVYWGRFRHGDITWYGRKLTQ